MVWGRFNHTILPRNQSVPWNVTNMMISHLSDSTPLCAYCMFSPSESPSPHTSISVSPGNLCLEVWIPPKVSELLLEDENKFRWCFARLRDRKNLSKILFYLFLLEDLQRNSMFSLECDCCSKAVLLIHFLTNIITTQHDSVLNGLIPEVFELLDLILDN